MRTAYEWDSSTPTKVAHRDQHVANENRCHRLEEQRSVGFLEVATSTRREIRCKFGVRPSCLCPIDPIFRNFR